VTLFLRIQDSAYGATVKADTIFTSNMIYKFLSCLPGSSDETEIMPTPNDGILISVGDGEQLMTCDLSNEDVCQMIDALTQIKYNFERRAKNG